MTLTQTSKNFTHTHPDLSGLKLIYQIALRNIKSFRILK
nr:MAG TPA: hypothetical protein [Caudoviricetes sp.]DAR50818.1 MAG TPA: hypothetical protein [Caudoviricetes sp.]